MKLIDIITAVEGRVCGGSEFQWRCWGDNARFMEFADADGMEFCDVVFDTKTYDVYDVNLYVPGTDQCFKWLNPEFKDAYLNECKMRNQNPYTVYDDVLFAEILDTKVLIEFAKDICATYYDNLPILEQ